MRVRFHALALCVALSVCGPAQAQFEIPEPAFGRIERSAVAAKDFMVVAANPLATNAGYEMLKQGGSAIDAAIAVQLVLNLVEPQSSGIGGGALIMHYDAASKSLAAYDGRETAPAAATPERFLGADGKPMRFMQAVLGGNSVGVPGVLRALELAHRKHGTLPWASLFQPAIRLAEDGFAVSPRLEKLLATERYLVRSEAARKIFYNRDGTPLKAGQRLRNPEFAAVLKRIAREGARAFYEGEIARDIVTAIRAAENNPGDMTEADLAGYRAKTREPLCAAYHSDRICGFPLPSSGALTALQMLGMLAHFDMGSASFAVPSQRVMAVHLMAEAGKLAYSDRELYMADPDFSGDPSAALLDVDYLARRAQLIQRDHAMPRGTAGDLHRLAMGSDASPELPSTSHISIVDRRGNALSMTTTIETGFGSRLMVHGFLLNNELTDFSLSPVSDGKPVANRVEAGKRPRSSMTPIIVFDSQGRVKLVVGSPGGSAIINYVAKVLLAVLDWNMDIQTAIALPNFGSRNFDGTTELEKNTQAESLAPGLTALGHKLRVIDFNSGLQGIQRTESGWLGGTDPRREGVARGD